MYWNFGLFKHESFFFGKEKVWSFPKVSKVVISGTKVLAKN